MIYAIPGNHDLPHHNLREIERSAYWTLVEAGVISNLTHGTAHGIGQMDVTPFPHTIDVEPSDRQTGLCPSVALIHSFIWTKDTGHPGASPDSHWNAWVKRLSGYDIAVFGDNHKGFVTARQNDLAIINCGTFMRRTMDEKDYKPFVGLIMSDWTVRRELLDVSADQFTAIDKIGTDLSEALRINLDRFAEALNELHSEQLNYAKLVMLYLEQNDVPDEVKRYMLNAIGVRP